MALTVLAVLSVYVAYTHVYAETFPACMSIDDADDPELAVFDMQGAHDEILREVKGPTREEILTGWRVLAWERWRVRRPERPDGQWENRALVAARYTWRGSPLMSFMILGGCDSQLRAGILPDGYRLPVHSTYSRVFRRGQRRCMSIYDITDDTETPHAWSWVLPPPFENRAVTEIQGSVRADAWRCVLGEAPARNVELLSQMLPTTERPRSDTEVSRASEETLKAEIDRFGRLVLQTDLRDISDHLAPHPSSEPPEKAMRGWEGFGGFRGNRYIMDSYVIASIEVEGTTAIAQVDRLLRIVPFGSPKDTAYPPAWVRIEEWYEWEDSAGGEWGCFGARADTSNPDFSVLAWGAGSSSKEERDMYSVAVEKMRRVRRH